MFCGTTPPLHSAESDQRLAPPSHVAGTEAAVAGNAANSRRQPNNREDHRANTLHTTPPPRLHRPARLGNLSQVE